jgi:ribosomal protein S27AE
MDLAALFLVLTVLVLAAILIFRPFWDKKQFTTSTLNIKTNKDADQREHKVSSLIADKERLLNAIQELEFDHATGKITDELFPEQRTELLHQAAGVLHQLNELSVPNSTVSSTGSKGSASKPEYDDIEELIAQRKSVQKKKTTGFCPKCGNAIKDDDQFCPRCGTTLQNRK